MKWKSKFALTAIGAAMMFGAASGAAIADSRYILTVDSGQECNEVFRSLGGASELRWKFPYSGSPDGTQQNPPAYTNLPPTLIVNVDFSETSPTTIVKWTSLALPPVPPETVGFAAPVNALLVRLSNGKYLSDDTLIVFYPQGLLEDQAIDLAPMLTSSVQTTSTSTSSVKKIKSLSFCYGVSPRDLGYAACPITDTAALTTACSYLRPGSFFVVNNAADFTRGGLDENGLPAKPALCACTSQDVITTPCDPQPGKENSCPGTAPGSITNKINSEEQVGFQGSCVVKMCTKVFGREICNTTTTNSPNPPCGSSTQ